MIETEYAIFLNQAAYHLHFMQMHSITTDIGNICAMLVFYIADIIET